MPPPLARKFFHFDHWSDQKSGLSPLPSPWKLKNGLGALPFGALESPLPEKFLPTPLHNTDALVCYCESAMKRRKRNQSVCSCMIADVNECNDPDVCANGGTCVDAHGGYSCRCPPGTTGQQCQLGDVTASLSAISLSSTVKPVLKLSNDGSVVVYNHDNLHILHFATSS